MTSWQTYAFRRDYSDFNRHIPVEPMTDERKPHWLTKAIATVGFLIGFGALVAVWIH